MDAFTPLVFYVHHTSQIYYLRGEQDTLYRPGNHGISLPVLFFLPLMLLFCTGGTECRVERSHGDKETPTYNNVLLLFHLRGSLHLPDHLLQKL